MAPLKEDEMPAIGDLETALSVTKVLDKRSSFDSVGSATMPIFSGLKHLDFVLTSELRAGFQQLSAGCSELLDAVHGTSTAEKDSPTLHACRGSLQTDMTIMLSEASHLLDDAESKEVTTWKASLAQVRADSYLDTIQSALACRALLDNELWQVTSSLSSQLSEEKKSPEDIPVRISSWRTPILCFDLELSDRVQYLYTDPMPLKVRATAIAEVFAKDIGAGSIPSYLACRLVVEQCKHEEQSFQSLAGTVGKAYMKFKVSPVGNAQKKNSTWGVDEHVGELRVAEARM
jgi:hypothetical protein